MSAAIELTPSEEELEGERPEARRLRLLDDYTPTPRQTVFHALRTRYRKRIRVVKAGRRGGKTRSAGADFVDSALHDYADKRAGRGRYAHLGPSEFGGWRGSDPEPFLHYWVIAPTYELLGEPARYLQAGFGLAEDGGLILDQDRSRGTWRLEGGIRIDLRSAERPKLLVSRGLDGAWGDEAARWKEDVWTEHVYPTLADHSGWFTATSTPLGRNWFWRDLWCPGDPVEAAIAREAGEEVGLDPDFGCVEWWTEHNTAVPGLVAEVEAARARMPPAVWRRSFRADFSAFVGQVFALDRETHLRHGMRWLRSAFDLGVVAGYDHGWTHPGVLTIWGARSLPPYFVELETIEARHLPVTSTQGDGWRDVAERMRRKWGFREVFVPADAKEAEHAFREAGLSVRAAYQDRFAGVTWFQTVLHNGWAVFSSPHALARFEALRHPPGYGPDSELWVKEGDDAFDASRYALTTWIRSSRLPNRSAPGSRFVEYALQR